MNPNGEYWAVSAGGGILVVDDDAALRQLVQVTLESGGFSPVTVSQAASNSLVARGSVPTKASSLATTRASRASSYAGTP